ncbi:hypothetical protein CHS0354_014339 [Potamilus streckersoni]|uniref:Ig-like domain-containing protein n=1 Tax=Potamilus streckersoni TaxID=2493646 RepID=A0AAE0SKR0_9BIVA|nr:hypothetical protein CHS0354_014339 [Potamilus streckersoni]
MRTKPIFFLQMMSTFACFLIGSVFGCVACEVVEVNAEINKPATLPCKVSNEGVSNTVQWYKTPDTILSIGKYSYNMRLSINQQHEGEWNIDIKRVHVEDSGEYTCKVGKQVMAQVVLVVKGPPMIHETHDMTFEEGDTGILWCNVTGFPTPSVRWYWKSPHQVEGIEHDSGAEGARLVLHNITRYYDNIYVCVASNIVATNRKEIRVHVKFGPNVEVFQDTITATEEQEVKLHCAVEAFPMEGKLEWVFENNGQEIREGLKYNISSDRDLVKDFHVQFLSMVIRKGHLGIGDYGKYICRTKNFSRGYKEKVVVLQKPTEDQDNADNITYIND